MTSTVTYNGDLRTTCTHLASGNQIVTDAPVDNQGRGEAFSPTDLVATALGTCMMTIMGIKARDLGLNIEGARADVNKIMAADPRRIAKVEVTFTMPPNHFTEKDKSLLEAAALACPVCKSLSLDCEQAIKFVW
ncbi:MAG: OsmC family protein [Saprospiraceae bacterium]|nr:OsmC family protein [Saprospiraceae bacterium]MCF8252550.1 OsmC family protein [Saprospiraceae bacterium]MCF8282591.1 OsmC family protein [Bacteroidales bacterium]MCF8310797.1 OsmC family protein [Saprospiraceae bacterium]MCF8439373.1 OsmC family protein [Saprospiraceae bacterium]